MAPLVAVLVGVGMLAVVPLGLRLVVGDDSRPRPPARWWTVAAVPAAVALWLPRGPLAVLLCTGYLVAAVTLAVRAAGAAASGALGRADARREAPGTGVRRGGTWSVRLALLTALVSPLVAAGALLAERGGYRLLGFPLPVSIVSGVLMAAAVGWVLSFAVGRVREFYLAMMTLGFGMIVYEVVREWTMENMSMQHVSFSRDGRTLITALWNEVV